PRRQRHPHLRPGAVPHRALPGGPAAHRAAPGLLHRGHRVPPGRGLDLPALPLVQRPGDRHGRGGLRPAADHETGRDDPRGAHRELVAVPRPVPAVPPPQTLTEGRGSGPGPRGRTTELPRRTRRTATGPQSTADSGTAPGRTHRPPVPRPRGPGRRPAAPHRGGTAADTRETAPAPGADPPRRTAGFARIAP